MTPEELISKMDDTMKGLVYLGRALERIAYKQMVERNDYTDAPILSALDYNGMNEQKVKQLIVQMWEAVRNYKINSGSEGVKYLSQAQTLISKNGKLLPPTENVYYILLGYSQEYLTALAQKEGGEKDE